MEGEARPVRRVVREDWRAEREFSILIREREGGRGKGKGVS